MTTKYTGQMDSTTIEGRLSKQGNGNFRFIPTDQSIPAISLTAHRFTKQINTSQLWDQAYERLNRLEIDIIKQKKEINQLKELLGELEQ